MLGKLIKFGLVGFGVVLAVTIGFSVVSPLAFLPNGTIDLSPMATTPAGSPPTQSPTAHGAETPGPSTTVLSQAPGTTPDTSTDLQASESNPWDKATLRVAIRNQAAPERTLTPAVRAATAYWEGAGREYADYHVSFQIVPDTEQPDLIVWYNSTIDCAAHSDAIGCAPLLNESANPRPPEHVQVRYAPSDNERQVRNTLIHEFGHILGVNHCDDPQWIMGPSCSGQVRPVPDVDSRSIAWRETKLTLHVDDRAVTPENQNKTTAQVNNALGYFRAGTGGTVPTNVSFNRVKAPWRADIVIRFVDEAACDQNAVVCIAGNGRDIDNDGELEYHTKGEITIEPIDVEARGWYVGWGLARLLTPDGVPTVLEDGASYDTRRSPWWE